MLTDFDAPWIEYLEIDEETGVIRLKTDTPQEIRDKYDEYYQKQNQNRDEPIAK